MRIANYRGRAVLLTGEDSAIDIAEASNGEFGPRLSDVFENWSAFQQWAASGTPQGTVVSIDRSQLGSPSPTPKQVIAVGLNYAKHAAESGFEVPDLLPPTFTKFVSSITGPDTVVALPQGGNTDWEVELVLIIGAEGHGIREEDAWSYVAGVTVGQDLSERVSQLQGPAPQFSLGKSFPGFTPLGPWLVTVDELPNRDDLEIGCSINGDVVQKGRTSELIFPVAALISRLSQTVTLYPGDVIFTGTPAGVGVGRDPQRFLKPGEILTSWIEGVGHIEQRFIEAGGAE
ncbi:fumarylacetoacetate hydrolase family protein [Arthrobacter sp. SD76]|uniref:fumarylacetoacetate hydrolase family protein n=1 Tax=Arthrobacter sp. SD76 TaxID=3415007 RepID=UPI003C74BCB6